MNLFYRFLLLIIFTFTLSQAQSTGLSAVIDADPDYPQYSRITLENSLIKVVIRPNQGGYAGTEHAIRDIIIKSSGQDIVSTYMDACTQRPPANNVSIVFDGSDKKTVRLEYNLESRSGITEYTIFRDKYEIKVDYISYNFGGWANIVDRTSSGGVHKVTGMEAYGPLVYYPESYWNTFDIKDYPNHPTDAGALNYRGHLIFGRGGLSATSAGYVRTLPIFSNSSSGGSKILKILQDGYENFPATGQSYRPVFTSYIIPFQSGIDNALQYAKGIIDNISGNQLAPIITAHPASISIGEGQSAVFRVNASGAAPLTYQWMRNGFQIPGATLSEYNTGAVTLSNSGETYSCLISNSYGQVQSANAVLTVLTAPPPPPSGGPNLVINGGFESGSVTSWGQSNTFGGAVYSFSVNSASPLSGNYDAIISVQSAGTNNSRPLITASLSQNKITGEKYIFNFTTKVISGNPAISYINYGSGLKALGSLTGTNQWSFTAESANNTTNSIAFYVDGTKAGSFSIDDVSFTKVIQAAPPTITSQPQNVTVTEGMSAVFSITAEGSQPLAYQWLLNGNEIPGAVSSSYTIVAAQLNLSGSFFSCRLTNSEGSVTSASAILTVNQDTPPPPPTSENLVLNSGFETGTLSSWGQSNTLGGAGYTFAVNSSNPIDGSYEGLITITLPGSNNSRPLITATLSENKVSGGKYIFSFTTKVISGSPGIGYINYGTGLKPIGSLSGLRTWEFTVDAANNTTNSIAFYVDGTKTGSFAIDNVSFSRLSSPLIISNPQNTEKYETQQTVFYAQASGTPPLSYKWFKNGIEIPGADSSSYKTPVLTLSDSGSTFYCRVSNSLGTVESASALLSVLSGKPVISINPMDTEVNEGTEANFSISVSGLPPFTFKWLKNGTEVLPGNSQLLSINPALLTDSGSVYYAVVSNPIDSAVSAGAILKVNKANTPVISIWYGDHQKFGHLGKPQRQINILGNVSSADTVTSLKYKLNGGTERTLWIGPQIAPLNIRRLYNKGDFIIEINTETDSDLDSNAVNTLVIKAIGRTSAQVTEKTVTFDYFPSQTAWTLPYSVKFDTLSFDRLRDFIQIVDGKWKMDEEGLRTDEAGYDRTFAIGDISWKNYEILVKFKIKQVMPKFSAPSYGAAFAIITGWTGHSNLPGSASGFQPLSGWWPYGVFATYSWINQYGAKVLEILGNQDRSIAKVSDNAGNLLKLNEFYFMKLRSESDASAPDIFRLKIWPAASEEPASWNLQGQHPDGNQIPESGSVLFVAHHTDVIFSEINISSLDSQPMQMMKAATDKILPEKYEFRLYQNYPNPFNPETIIKYSLETDSDVRIEVYNIIGEKVREYALNSQPRGYNELKFHSGNLSSGIYFYKLAAIGRSGKNFTEIKKMILLK